MPEIDQVWGSSPFATMDKNREQQHSASLL